MTAAVDVVVVVVAAVIVVVVARMQVLILLLLLPMLTPTLLNDTIVIGGNGKFAPSAIHLQYTLQHSHMFLHELQLPFINLICPETPSTTDILIIAGKKIHSCEGKLAHYTVSICQNVIVWSDNATPSDVS